MRRFSARSLSGLGLECAAPVVLLAAVCATLASSCQSSPGQARRAVVAPDANIIVISFDALRADALGAYGSDRGATPTMDAFAAESRVYDNAYAVAPRTPMSFSGFFSGMLPTRVFVGWKFRARTTMAGLLSEAGYVTAAFVNNVQLTAERDFDQGFQHYEWRRSGTDLEILEEAMTWLDHQRERKVFLWLHMLRPHAPYRDHPEARHLYRQKDPGSFPETTGTQFEATSSTDVARIRDLYFGEVWAADRLFARVIDHLRNLDLLERSIVVLTSDHGEELADHGGFQHGKLFEEHLRIPLMLHHPAIEGGVRIERRVRGIDLLPTLLGLVGHPVERRFDGTDLEAGPEDEPLPVVAASVTGEPEAMSLLDGDHKLIVQCRPERGTQLYDLGEDPGETEDLARREPHRVRRLQRNLEKLVGGEPCRTIRVALSQPGIHLHELTRKALRALGYAG